MNSQIEQLKRTIASDEQSARALEIEALTERLEDLSLDVKQVDLSDLPPHLDPVIRSYWGAMILARQAIALAERNRPMSGAPLQPTERSLPKLTAVIVPTT